VRAQHPGEPEQLLGALTRDLLTGDVDDHRSDADQPLGQGDREEARGPLVFVAGFGLAHEHPPFEQRFAGRDDLVDVRLERLTDGVQFGWFPAEMLLGGASERRREGAVDHAQPPVDVEQRQADRRLFDEVDEDVDHARCVEVVRDLGGERLAEAHATRHGGLDGGLAQSELPGEHRPHGVTSAFRIDMPASPPAPLARSAWPALRLQR
jgi:hypothetical protein